LADATALRVERARAQRVEGVRPDLRLGVELEADAEEFTEEALRLDVGREKEWRLLRGLGVALGLYVARGCGGAVSLEPQLGDLDAAQKKFCELALVGQLLRGHEGHGRGRAGLCTLFRRVLCKNDWREYNRKKNGRRCKRPENTRWHSENPASCEFFRFRLLRLPS